MNSKYCRCFARITAALLGAAVFITGCAREVPPTESVKFAVFGNTSPVSPFSGFTASLDPVISAIEAEKPAIVIHTGGAIYGGSESEGIFERDVRRQLGIFFAAMKNFRLAYYTIPGERDMYNGSSSLYAEVSGRRTWYSFNYGSIHFIALDTSAAGESFIDEVQVEWLKRDLHDYRSSNAVFVFMNRSFVTGKKRGAEPPVPAAIHKLFMEYRVKGVFSGGGSSYSSAMHDSVRYIQAGCGGFTDEKDNRRFNQYYVVTFTNGELNVQPGKVPLPKKK